MENGFYQHRGKKFVYNWYNRDPAQQGEKFLCDKRHDNPGRPHKITPERATELIDEFLPKNHEQGTSLRQFAKEKGIDKQTLSRAIKYHPTRNPNGIKPYAYRTRSYGFASEDEFRLWKAKRLQVATCLLNSDYKTWIVQDEGNFDSNKTFNKKNNYYWKKPIDEDTPVPTIVKSKFRNKDNWVHFSVLYTYDKKIAIQFFTQTDVNGRLQWRKLDYDLFKDTVLTKIKEYEDQLIAQNLPQRKLLYDGASIHTGKSYKWLDENNIPHLKSWSKKRRNDVDPSNYYTPYSADFNPAEFMVYTVKEKAQQKLRNIAYPTREQVVEKLTEAWNEVPMALIKKNFKHGWRKRLRECIKADGDFGSIARGYM